MGFSLIFMILIIMIFLFRILLEKMENDLTKKTKKEEDKNKEVSKLKNSKDKKNEEYERVMENGKIIVDMKTRNVTLPYMLLKEEDLRSEVLEYIETGKVSKMKVENIITKITREKIEDKNNYSSEWIFRNYSLKEIEKYINENKLPPYIYEPFNVCVNKLIIKPEELKDRENDEKFIQLFKSFDNYLEVKKNIESLILTQEEYEEYKRYLERLRELKIKSKAKEYYEKEPMQKHTEYLIELDKEIAKLNNQ